MDTGEKHPKNISEEVEDVHFRFKLEAGQCVNIDISTLTYASVHSGNLHQFCCEGAFLDAVRFGAMEQSSSSSTSKLHSSASL